MNLIEELKFLGTFKKKIWGGVWSGGGGGLGWDGGVRVDVNKFFGGVGGGWLGRGGGGSVGVGGSGWWGGQGGCERRIEVFVKIKKKLGGGVGSGGGGGGVGLGGGSGWK